MLKPTRPRRSQELYADRVIEITLRQDLEKGYEERHSYQPSNVENARR